MYTDLKVVLKLGREKQDIQQSVGVRQGHNMALVLFLFLMTAFAETLEEEWNNNGLKKISFSHATLNNLSSGQLIGHPTRNLYEGENSEIQQILYMDDVSF